MAMAKPVVATHAAMVGIENANDEFKSYISDSEKELAHICEKILLDGDHKKLGDKGRKLVINHFSWDSHLDKINTYMKKEKS